MVRIPEIIILFYYSLNLYLLIVKLIFTDYTIFNIKKKYIYINKVISIIKVLVSLCFIFR